MLQCRGLLPLVLVAAAGCSPYLVASPRIYLDPDRDPFASVSPDQRSAEVTLLYATDRKPEEGSPEGDRRYTWERERSLGFGLSKVRFGPDLSWEELVAATRTQYRKTPVLISAMGNDELGRIPETRYEIERIGATLRVIPLPQESVTLAEGMLQRMVESRLEAASRKDIFLFVHGYANSFQDATFSMAQIWHFLGREGVPFVYSWPAGSSGLLRGYTHDRESGEYTIYRLKQVLRILIASRGLRKLHVIAHSRGTDVFLTALRELYLEDGRRVEGDCIAAHLGTVVLAAPDIDFDVLGSRVVAEGLFFVPERLVIYVSEGDRAIGIANWLFSGMKRLGRLQSADLKPEALEQLKRYSQIEVIDARVYGFSSWGHDYFYSHPAASSDLCLLLREGKVAGVEGGRPLRREDNSFWILENDYPIFPKAKK